MHESPLCEAVLAAVLERAGGRRVTHVAVSVGAQHRAVAEPFVVIFEHVAEGTVAASATVELSDVPATYSCVCGSSGELIDPLPLCPACAEPVRPVGGDEVQITEVVFAAG